jgi:hypothetical protein
VTVNLLSLTVCILSEALLHRTLLPIGVKMPYLDTRIKHLRSAGWRCENEASDCYLTVALRPPPEDKLSTPDHGKDKYAYKFDPPPQQSEPILHQMKILLRGLNREHMGFAAGHIRVYQTTISEYPLSPHPFYPFLDYKLYTFVDNFDEFPPTAAVTISHPTGALTTDSLYAKIGKEWLPSEVWLLSKKIPKEYLVSEAGYNAQRMW